MNIMCGWWWRGYNIADQMRLLRSSVSIIDKQSCYFIMTPISLYNYCNQAKTIGRVFQLVSTALTSPQHETKQQTSTNFNLCQV